MKFLAWCIFVFVCLYLSVGLLVERLFYGGGGAFAYEKPPGQFIRASVVIFWPCILFLLYIDYDPDVEHD